MLTTVSFITLALGIRTCKCCFCTCTRNTCIHFDERSWTSGMMRVSCQPVCRIICVPSQTSPMWIAANCKSLIPALWPLFSYHTAETTTISLVCCLAQKSDSSSLFCKENHPSKEWNRCSSSTPLCGNARASSECSCAVAPCHMFWVANYSLHSYHTCEAATCFLYMFGWLG